MMPIEMPETTPEQLEAAAARFGLKMVAVNLEDQQAAAWQEDRLVGLGESESAWLDEVLQAAERFGCRVTRAQLRRGLLSERGEL